MTIESGADETLVGTIEKNKKERLHVSLSEYRGYDLISLRVWYLDEKKQSWQPGKQGLALRVELLPQLANLLQQALVVARQQHLISSPASIPVRDADDAKDAAAQLAESVFGRSGHKVPTP